MPEDGDAGEPVVSTRALTKRFGATVALDELSLDVDRGEVFALLGPNGAGKTTTIRLLLDLVRPTSGEVRVFGLDVRRDGPAVRRRVSYLPGDLRLAPRLRARETVRFYGSLRGGVDERRVEQLAERLGLDLDRPVGDLSKGNRQKVGIVVAFAPRAELLVLDEPTSGLDPLVQQTVHELVDEATAEGSTVLMSSHVLSEVQRMADRAAIVRRGRLVTVESIESLRLKAARRIEVRFDEPVPAGAFAGVPGVRDLQAGDTWVRAVVDGPLDAFVKAAARFRVDSITSEEPDLDDVFLSFYGDDGDAPVAAVGAGEGARRAP